MTKDERIQLLNKYQGMINSKVASLLNKAKKLKENNLDEETLADIESNIDTLKKSEANVVKLLNRYCSKISN
jgi:hypothetical protein